MKQNAREAMRSCAQRGGGARCHKWLIRYYDLVFGAMVVAWLWQQPHQRQQQQQQQQQTTGDLQRALGCSGFDPALAHLTGIAFGPLFIVPLFIVALQMSVGARPAAVAASSSRLSSAQ